MLNKKHVSHISIVKQLARKTQATDMCPRLHVNHLHSICGGNEEQLQYVSHKAHNKASSWPISDYDMRIAVGCSISVFGSASGFLDQRIDDGECTDHGCVPGGP